MSPADAPSSERVLYSGFRFHHHQPGSGYDAVVGEPRDYVCGDSLPLARHPDRSTLRHLNFLLTDLVTLARGLGYDTVHYFYPENTAYLSPWLLRLAGKRIVYTLHLAECEWLEAVPSPFMRLKQLSLRSAHAIAVLSRQQEERYRRAFRDKLVAFVPHGFGFDDALEPPLDTFVARRRERRLVVVGQNYRDLDLLERIIQTRGERAVRFELAGMDAPTRQRFAHDPSVRCHAWLDPAAYDALLRSAFAMVLPLTFATANNALLEAYEAYLPVLASRIPGITDYAVDGDRSLFESAEEFWSKYDALARLSAPEFRRECARLREAARAQFSWTNVREQLRRLYAGECEGVRPAAPDSAVRANSGS